MQVVKLGASKVDATTGVPMARAQLDLGDGEVSEYGEIPMLQCLGVTALPAAASPDGSAAEGVVDEELGGLNGTVVGGRDVRSADVAKGLGPGGTAVHSTGADSAKRSQVRCLEDVLALLVGNDSVVSMDRGADLFQIAFGEALIEINGGKIRIVAKGGKAGILIDGESGSLCLFGAQVILGGLNFPPAPGVTNVLYGPAGIAGVPATGVHIVPA